MNKREVILSEALKEFSSNDYKNASVNRIIEHAKTSKGNFYHYFKNKEDLYITLLKEAWTKKTEFMCIDEGNDLFSFLQKQVLAGIRFSKENPEYYRLSRRFANEKNTKLYNRVLSEIGAEYNIGNFKYDAAAIHDDLPENFVNSFMSLIINNMNELIDENDDLLEIEKKLHLLIKILKNGLEKK